MSGSFPSGPTEAYFGDALRSSLIEWAQQCHDRSGLAVAPHFPYPTGEVAAAIVNGVIDAVELYPTGAGFDNLRFLDWYRCLNCGFRLPAVGGTDKMGAYSALGSIRTYANLGQEEFSFANWARAVRAGNTFTTTGPLLLFQVEGRVPGEEIVLRAGGATLEARVEARSFVPFERVEIVFNGTVVASRERPGGARKLEWAERIQVPGPGWLAARCASRIGPATRFYTGTAAHTSPVYVVVRGQELFSHPAAAYLLTLIEGAQTWVEDMATRPDPASFERIRRGLAQAHSVLDERMRRHRHPA
jgi:hypothetical protein